MTLGNIREVPNSNYKLGRYHNGNYFIQFLPGGCPSVMALINQLAPPRFPEKWGCHLGLLWACLPLKLSPKNIFLLNWDETFLHWKRELLHQITQPCAQNIKVLQICLWVYSYANNPINFILLSLSLFTNTNLYITRRRQNKSKILFSAHTGLYGLWT